MTRLSRMARVLSVSLIASSAIFAIGLLLTSSTDGTASLFLPFAGAFAAIAVLLTLAQPEVHRLLLKRLHRHREAFYVGTLLVGTLVAAAHYGLAIVALQYGPNPRGFEFLSTANAVALVTVAIAAPAQVLLAARGAKRVRERVVALLLLAATTTVPAVAVGLLGRTMSTTQPLDQPTAVYSLALAMWGVGSQLTAIPVAFAAAAALVPLTAWTRRRLLAARAMRRRAGRHLPVTTGPVPAG